VELTVKNPATDDGRNSGENQDTYLSADTHCNRSPVSGSGPGSAVPIHALLEKSLSTNNRPSCKEINVIFSFSATIPSAPG
jgi:hypothetical protein